MIALLRGTVLSRDMERIVLDVGGVGYEVIVTVQAAGQLTEGQSATLLIAENIKDDSYTLYGFIDSAQKTFYRQLLSVNGVGPKAAMTILSSHEVTDLLEAVRTGQPALFSSVSGVGSKTAQRIVLELKGKIDLSEQGSASNDSAHQALVSLGYSTQQAGQVLAKLDISLPVGERIKQALKELGK